MKVIIYWFSGTGNSLMVARELANQLGTACELVPVIAAVKEPEKITSAERVVFAYPVYAFGIPALVAEFIKKFPVKPETAFYSLATLAGMAGAPHLEIKHLLRARGGTLGAGWSIIMPSNYTPFGGPCREEKQQRQFAAMKKKVQEIAGTVKNGGKAKLEDSLFPLSWLGRLIHIFAIRTFRKEAKKFWAKASCTGCGLCAKVCPVKNIEIKDGKPIWLDRCEACFACLQWCPAEAIQFGKSTDGRKRYHHPDVKPQDLFREKS